MRWAGLRLLVAGLTAGGVLVVPVATAAGADVGCGDDITTDVVLQHDLGPCGGDFGLTVFTSGVTVDLNGHTIHSDPSRGFIGILVNADRVTVRNGMVKGFAVGVYTLDGSGVTVRGMTLTGNVGAGPCGFQEGDGLFVFGTSHSTFSGNVISANGTSTGIRLGGTDNLVSGNLVQANKYPAPDNCEAGTQQTVGIKLGDGYVGTATASRVVGNRVVGNGFDGIELNPGSDGNLVRGNDVRLNGTTQLFNAFVPRYGDGIAVFSDLNVIEANSAIGNGGNGIRISGRQNTIRANRAFGNRAGSPLLQSVSDLRDTAANCAGNTWNSNSFGTSNQACIS